MSTKQDKAVILQVAHTNVWQAIFGAGITQSVSVMDRASVDTFQT